MFCFKRRKIPQKMIVGEDDQRIKSLTETYKMNTFLLALGLMYPNKRSDPKRMKMIGCLILVLVPGLITMAHDVRLRLLHNDVPNLVRQSIISISLIFIIVKLISTIFRRNELQAIFNVINTDYEKFNNLPEEYKKIVFDTIKKTKGLEKAWVIMVAMTAASYPGLAAICTIYSVIFSDNPRRYMIHETAVLFLTEEEKYESPYFELFALYSLFIAWVIFVGFTGYDGMFSVCILHVSLKIKIFCQNLKYLFVDTTDLSKIKRNLAEFVKDHCEVIRLIGEIQKCFELWLVGIFFNAVLQIGMALIQITSDTVKGSEINAMYYLFALATVVHIYLPCYLASDVTHNAAEIANVAYTCSWELVQDKDIRKSIAIIISKAQNPIHFRAFGMLTFNMEMFVSILQTSYSTYTLLRS